MTKHQMTLTMETAEQDTKDLKARDKPGDLIILHKSPHSNRQLEILKSSLPLQPSITDAWANTFIAHVNITLLNVSFTKKVTY